ncbi:hypothetical protein CRG98_018203 [Punica granatum]|uniref:Retrotransposon gag domain-containing protein n=1 Tax=Punica granatum TaxID=22663 RepID=A0A2I0JYL5_PUNGR|nr:hypothetical protein CRG98_018203 [Punica granatum]
MRPKCARRGQLRYRTAENLADQNTLEPITEDQVSQAPQETAEAPRNQDPPIHQTLAAMTRLVEQQAQLIEQQMAFFQRQAAQPSVSTSHMESQLTPYERFRKYGPSSFSGSADPIEAENWISGMERIFSIMEVSDTQHVALATFMLEGDAQYWWEATQRRLDPNSSHVITWAEFTQAFYNKNCKQPIVAASSSASVGNRPSVVRGRGQMSSNKSVQSRGGGSRVSSAGQANRPMTQGRVFTLTKRDAEATPTVVTGIEGQLCYKFRVVIFLVSEPRKLAMRPKCARRGQLRYRTAENLADQNTLEPITEDQVSQAPQETAEAPRNQDPPIHQTLAAMTRLVEQQAQLIEQQMAFFQRQAAQPSVSTSHMESQLTPYERFRKYGPSSFSGSADPIEAENWISGMERIFSIMEVSDTQHVALATFMLEGDAQYWWEATQRRLDPNSSHVITWAEFTQAFYNKYFQPRFGAPRSGNF